MEKVKGSEYFLNALYSIFCYSLNEKCTFKKNPPPIYTQYPIQTLYSVFVEALLAAITALSLLGTPAFGGFLPFSSADPLKLCQVGLEVSLHSYFSGLSRDVRLGSNPDSGWATQGH